jgi:hypothetical protein
MLLLGREFAELRSLIYPQSFLINFSEIYQDRLREEPHSSNQVKQLRGSHS